MKKKNEVVMPSRIDADLKIRLIKASKMPEQVKEKYIYRIMEKTRMLLGKSAEAISLGVYVRLKKTNPELIAAMENYPKAVGVKAATMAMWDDIFKNF
jgi:antitoxin component of RelBE/YafQ-DinJ toxin-antitoxin module